jgi:hypothetical protein
MDESLAGLCELDWFKQSSSSTAALVRSFQIGGDFGDFGELSEAESTFSDQLITVNI